MSNINLPHRFNKKLEENQFLDGVVKTTLSNFSDVLKDNLYFFEEYTDHGISHIENVISSTDNIVSDPTIAEILTTKDVAYYILAVLLHDIGMHLGLDGFKKLLNGDFDNLRIKEFDRYTWKELWDDFLNEAKKFNGKQLREVFGDANAIIRNPPINNPGQINGNDKKLIGEFIRRNHPRLAHEISLNGLPGKSKLEFANELEEKEKYLIGFIARSHGINLRKCVDQVEDIYGKSNRRYPLNVHAIYLMVLLRLSDYIQIDSSRTSKTLLKLKRFGSPISEIEHDAHLSIDSIDDKFQDDPERIYVSASPKNSFMFLKLQNLLKDIQHEFDISWAVLGELYGSIEIKPQIKYRRIKSNLEEPHFFNNQTYIADNFSFNANNEIIKLLIAPLYGDSPTYGIRELLQNSIDACRERSIICTDNYDALVNVEIFKESEETYFMISDNGIGMDSNILKNYFFSVGASFRKSLEWQKEFVNDDGDSKVRRSGRFGIGVLAAFLIGKEIYVETKSINSSIGYKFFTDINIEQINVIKDDNIPIGTTIKIKINQNIINKLSKMRYATLQEIEWYNWYTLSYPKIQYGFLDDRKTRRINKPNPEVESVPIDWNQIDSEGYNKILWTYSTSYNPAKFTCNGIVIPISVRDINYINFELIGDVPKISVFDNDAHLPLNLSRDGFISDLSFKGDLENDVYKDFIAYFLTYDIDSIIEDDKISLANQSFMYPGFSKYYTHYSFGYGANAYKKTNYGSNISVLMRTYFVCKKGFIVDYSYFLKKLEKIDALFFQANDISLINLKIDIKDRFIKFSNNMLSSIEDYKVVIEPQQDPIVKKVE